MMHLKPKATKFTADENVGKKEDYDALNIFHDKYVVVLLLAVVRHAAYFVVRTAFDASFRFFSLLAPDTWINRNHRGLHPAR